jgi:hypothetical protein
MQQQRALQQRCLQQRCLQHFCLQHFCLQQLGAQQVGWAQQLGSQAGAAQQVGSQAGAQQVGSQQAGLQQRFRWWQQRCFLHFTLQQTGAQHEGSQQAGAPQVGSQHPALADDRLARYIKPVASIAATNARLFMGRLLKTQETLETFVAEPHGPALPNAGGGLDADVLRQTAPRRRRFHESHRRSCRQLFTNRPPHLHFLHLAGPDTQSIPVVAALGADVR